MTVRAGPWSLFRAGLAVVQGLLHLFVAGAVIYEAHTLFLRYYDREWRGIQFAGVDNCASEERIVNGDLFDGQTLCNKPQHFARWAEIYRRHWKVAAVYYGLGLIVFLGIGYSLMLIQRRLTSAAPFGGAPPAPPPQESEHLR